MSYERYRDWLIEALDDYQAALDLYKHGRFSKVCYLSHQAAEKAVKALSIKKLHKYPTIHSVAEILRRLSKKLNIPEKLIEAGRKLDKHYILSRYPNAWPYGAPCQHYTKEDAEEALKNAREVIEYVKREISRNPKKS